MLRGQLQFLWTTKAGSSMCSRGREVRPNTTSQTGTLSTRESCGSFPDWSSASPRHFASIEEDEKTTSSPSPYPSAHVHLNEPGRTDWEGFATGTQAAISGGVTTVVDMPLNSIPPTTTVDHLETKRAAARGQCWCDVAFWGGVVPGNAKDLRPLIEAGVKGFKCFLIESGVDVRPSFFLSPFFLFLLKEAAYPNSFPDDLQEFPCVTEADLHPAFDELAQSTKPTVLAFHAELDAHPKSEPATTGDPKDYSTFLASRPPALEEDAISLITTKLMPAHPSVRCHIVHLSAASALPLVRAAKSASSPALSLTTETCFHYLALADGDVPAGAPEFKCCPPIRSESNRDALWDALREGTIDMVVSDHSPCVAELKRPGGAPRGEADFMSAWGGISTLGLGLSVLWTEARKRGVSVAEIVEWTAVNTAKHAGLDERKGKIQKGFDADLVLWDPEATFTVSVTLIHRPFLCHF